MGFWRCRGFSSKTTVLQTLAFPPPSLVAGGDRSLLFSSLLLRHYHPSQTLAAPPSSSPALPGLDPLSFVTSLLFRRPAYLHPAAVSDRSWWLFVLHRYPPLMRFSTSFSKDENEDHLPKRRFVPVKAYFLSTSIDLRSLQNDNVLNLVRSASRSNNSVVLRFYDVKNDSQVMELDSTNESNCRDMVVFQYGSVVLFNVPEHEADDYLKIVEKHASGLLPEMRKDDYMVVEMPNLESWMQGGLDYIMLKNLSIDGIRTVGSVLGQSIALDYYIWQVDGMVEEYTNISREMEKIGTFTMKKKELFQMVGKANSNLADVIHKLGLFERSDIAWKDANYAQIWEYLRDEYELTQRFSSLDFKLKFVEHNTLFLLEVLQNRNSEFREWMIIVLIALEILISLYAIFIHLL